MFQKRHNDMISKKSQTRKKCLYLKHFSDYNDAIKNKCDMITKKRFIEINIVLRSP